MKALNTPQRVRKSTNCGGPEQWFNEQYFEVETTDVGNQWPHYGGHNHGWYKVTAEDVGRQFVRTTQGNQYQCWVFIN